MRRAFACGLALVMVWGGLALSGCGQKFEAPPAGYVDPTTDVPTLMKDLDNKEASARSVAIFWLAKMGPAAQAALPKLEKLAAKDKSPVVKAKAKEAIAKIKGG